MTDLAAQHDTLRPLMFSIAYRMLGSVTEAEDVIQEAFLRMHRNSDSPGEVRTPEAYAATVTTRLAIDHLRSARVRRERYVGTWLPEPLLTADGQADPAVRAEHAETLSQAFLVLLERLSPAERAVFLLREVFEYGYDEIASIIGKTPENCRQLFTRARSHIDADRPRFDVSPQRREALARRFFAACAGADLAELEQVLAEDVVFHADGGGKAAAVAKPVIGRIQVARFVLGLMRQAPAHGWRFEPVWVNGQPGTRVVAEGGDPVAVLSLGIAGDRIRAIYNVLNPDKLNHLARRR